MAHMSQENIFMQQTGISPMPEVAAGALNNIARKYGRTFLSAIKQKQRKNESQSL